MTDEDVIKSILQGEIQKYRILVEKYQQMVFKTSMGFLHNKNDADDLTQEIFIQAYQSLNRFRGTAAFSTWLYRITVNAALNKKRKSFKELLFNRIDSFLGQEIIEEDYFLPSDPENPEEIVIRKEHTEWLQKALDSLPDNQRTAIVLSKYDDLSQKEIAEIMNKTEGAVEALLQRAKKNLREKLSKTGKKVQD